VADGTFKIVKNTLFYQLFVVTATTPAGVTVPCVFALLPNKETASYAAVFKFLFDKELAGLSCAFHCDFEKGITNAFKMYYAKIPVYGCDAHFKRALRTHLTSEKYQLGLLYNTNTEFQTLIRYIWALSFVPEDHVVAVWEGFIGERFFKLKDKFLEQEEQVENYLNYVEKTWIGETNARTGVRKPPTFPHKLWNKHEAVMKRAFMTTNCAEGYNGSLTGSVPINCKIWTVVAQLATKESHAARRVRDSLLGPQACEATRNTARNLTRDRRHEELYNIVSTYGRVDIPTFMNTLIAYYQ
jgi:hypothetical protein